jgi:carbonic anhydrase/acetyltransferase-like protein (isoleucine patch superfamily)
MNISYLNNTPKIGQNVFIAPDAWVIGDVELGDDVTVLFGSSVRGDILPIRIGERSNLQEHVVIHTSVGRIPTTIGEEVTVGHRALIHGATIGNRVIVGMGSIILDEAEIGDECIIGAGSVVTEHKKIPPRSLVIGTPGRVVRELTTDELAFLPVSANRYVTVGRNYAALLGGR